MNTQQRSARRDAFLRSVGAQALRGGLCKEPTRCVFKQRIKKKLFTPAAK